MQPVNGASHSEASPSRQGWSYARAVDDAPEAVCELTCQLPGAIEEALHLRVVAHCLPHSRITGQGPYHPLQGPHKKRRTNMALTSEKNAIPLSIQENYAQDKENVWAS